MDVLDRSPNARNYSSIQCQRQLRIATSAKTEASTRQPLRICCFLITEQPRKIGKITAIVLYFYSMYFYIVY